MLSSKKFYEILKSNNINFYTGVPDSLLKDFCYFISKNISKNNHIITANEGTALSLATGYHLATNKIPFVYLQNSGIGNLINPLLSLTDKNVYSIPMLIMVGWRGEPNKKDEPQHMTQGKITIDLIKTLKKKYRIIDGKKNDYLKIKNLIKISKKENQPVFLVVKKNTFEKYNNTKKIDKKLITREQAIKILIDNLNDNFRIISSTGMISRELYEARKIKIEKKCKDFLTVGSMGHSSQIALGIALKSKKKIVCLDGDGAFLMHMGGASTIGSIKLNNFFHIMLNNKVHESVGGQPTTANTTNFCEIAKACGYKKIYGPLKSKEQIQKMFKSLNKIKKTPVFIEIQVNSFARKDVGRPKEKPVDNKLRFIKDLS
jgi:phosphonopyruvate decarboxylase